MPRKPLVEIVATALQGRALKRTRNINQVARIWTYFAIGLFMASRLDLAATGNHALAANHTIYVAAVIADAGGHLSEPTPTSSPLPVNTATPQATQTAAPSVTLTPAATQTPIPIVTASATATAVNILTPAATPTATNTPTPTITPQPTVTARPTQTPTRTPRPEPTPEGANVQCQNYADAQICAWVSDGSPTQYSYVTTYGRLILNDAPVSGANITTIWHYKTSTPTEECVTGTNGIGECTRWISRATIGYRVDVEVLIELSDTTYRTETFFIPQN